MWLAWPERIELYLGPGLALVRAPAAQRGHALAFGPGASVADMLAAVSVEVASWGRRRPWRVHVALGGAWCPAVGFEVPEGVAGHGERLALGRAAVGEDMQAEAPDGLDVRLDGRHAGLASGCAVGVLQALRDWCADGVGRRARLVSVAPFWAVATHCAAVGRHEGGLLVREPSCVTALVPRHRAAEALDALSVPCEPGDLGHGSSALPTALGGYLTALQVDVRQLLALDLTTAAQPIRADLPRLLAPHWALAREAVRP
ncbi:MAG: hypothetical protein QM617_00640 [Comamonas sp.]